MVWVSVPKGTKGLVPGHGTTGLVEPLREGVWWEVSSHRGCALEGILGPPTPTYASLVSWP